MSARQWYAHSTAVFNVLMILVLYGIRLLMDNAAGALQPTRSRWPAVTTLAVGNMVIALVYVLTCWLFHRRIGFLPALVTVLNVAYLGVLYGIWLVYGLDLLSPTVARWPPVTTLAALTGIVAFGYLIVQRRRSAL